MPRIREPMEPSVQSPSSVDLAATPQALRDARQPLQEAIHPPQAPDGLAVPMDGTLSTQAANAKAAPPEAAGAVTPGAVTATVQPPHGPQGAGHGHHVAGSRMEGSELLGCEAPNAGPQLQDGFGTIPVDPGVDVEPRSQGEDAEPKPPVDEIAREAARIAKSQLLALFQGFGDSELGRILVLLKRRKVDWHRLLSDACPPSE